MVCKMLAVLAVAIVIIMIILAKGRFIGLNANTIVALVGHNFGGVGKDILMSLSNDDEFLIK